jgi:tetraacyldisaccharide 4'-kinase
MGVGANRYKNGMALARHGAEWFVLDDGFQHLQLARDVDIVLLDATDPFSGGKTLPAGRLREPISALRRADIVLITKSVQSPAPAIEAMVRRFTNCPIHYAATRLENVLRVPQLDVALPPEDWTRARFFAFCGIGNPAAFFEDLRRWDFQLAGERSFADHHVYTVQEAAQLEQLAQSCRADALLCTEKDVWNLRQVHFAGIPAYCCRIKVEVPAEAFNNSVQASLGRSRSESAA